MSRHAGTRYSRQRKNDLIAASRALRVLTELPRFALQGVEEVQYQRCRQLLDDQIARSHADAVGSEAGEHLEGVRVALDGARARPPVAGQVFTEEATQVCCQRRHVELPPSCRCSAAKATCRIKAGVASRYQ